MKKILFHLAGAIVLLAAILFEINAQPILDNTFSGDGYLLNKVSIAEDDVARTVLIQSNGRILTGGNSFGQIGNTDIHIIRTKSNGSMDNTFGVGGIATIPGGFFCDMALLSGGKIIVAGSGVGPTNTNNYIVYRFTKNGVLDTTFGNAGSVEVNMLYENMICNDVTIQPDGKILLGGYTSGVHRNMIIVRLKANGNLDNNFATGGIFKLEIANRGSACYQLAMQNDGKIVAGGFIDMIILNSYYIFDFGAVRLTASGILDNTFGDGGVVIANKQYVDAASSVSILSDGRIVLGGSTNNFGDNKFAALCLLTNGSLDSTFGTGGWSVPDFYGGNAVCNAMIVEPDDDIIMAGNASINAGNSYYPTVAMAKLLSNGIQDNAFGDYGLDTSFFGVASLGCNDIALQSDNKIIIAGARNVGAHSSYFIARYTNSPALQKESQLTFPSGIEASVYPNPNSGDFIVSFSNPLQEPITITIINLLGQVVYEDNPASSAYQTNLAITLSPDLADGIY